MADQNTQFYAILTNVGAAKQANADALGVPWKITQMGVGDANGTEPTPNATQTRLINEWRRAPLNQLKVDEKNSAIIVAEQVIPAEVGGKWIREIALYDADGDMIAVANCPPTFKPLLTQGSGRTQVVRMNLLVSSSSNVELKIDPAVVLATREYVDSRITEEINKLDSKQSVRAATTGNIVLAGLQVIDGVQLVAGDRVLVKNQAAAKDNGLYTVTVGAWPRAGDADSSAEVTPGLVVAVEQGAVQADTIWQLITDGPIVLGTTALVFRDITDGFARLLSPAFSGSPTSTTPDQFDSSKRLVTADFAKRMGLEYSSFVAVAASTALTVVNVGGLISASSAVPIMITLPSTVGIAQGATIAVVSAGAGAVTVAAAAGGDVVCTATGAAGSIALGPGDSAEFIKLAGQWRLVGGSIMLRYSQVMREDVFSTRPQFDNGKYLATTEFVQRSLGNHSGFVTLAVSAALTAAHAGKIVLPVAGAVSITLPAVDSMPPGSRIKVYGNQFGATILPPGGGAITHHGVNRVSIALGLYDTVEFTLTAASGWYVMGGSVGLQGASVFGASLLGNVCYQRLPSGDIEQWGVYVGAPSGSDTVITLPVAMLAVPTSIDLTFANFTNGENVGQSPVLQARSSTPGSITVRNLFSGAASFFWKVRGRV